MIFKTETYLTITDQFLNKYAHPMTKSPLRSNMIANYHKFYIQFFYKYKINRTGYDGSSESDVIFVFLLVVM